VHLARARRRRSYCIDREQRHGQFQGTNYYQEQGCRPLDTSRNGRLKEQGHRKRDHPNAFSKRPGRRQPPEFAKGVLADRPSYWIHLGQNDMEQYQ
jgi:hypothetical protein